MDAYDHMVAWLTENPSQIDLAWRRCCVHECGRLFAYATPSGDRDYRPGDDKGCGCLTMVRHHCSVAWTDAITVAIKSDERIPRSGPDITVDHLPIFAGWQRRIDKILNRTPPVWNGPPVAKPEVEMEAAPVTPFDIADPDAVEAMEKFETAGSEHTRNWKKQRANWSRKKKTEYNRAKRKRQKANRAARKTAQGK